MSSPLDELKPKAPKPTPEPVAAAPMTPEDAGSQALSDALRSSFAVVRIIMVILVVVFFASGIFTVPSQERAIVLRFGRPVGATQEQQLLGPGLHWSFPYPIDEVVHIPISQVQTVTSTTGWYATTPEAEATGNEPDAGISLNPATDGYTLTGDGNIIHIRMTLRYRINNPLDYVLNFVNASNVVQNALDSALIHVSTRFNVDQALRLEVTALKEQILAEVRRRVDEQGVGITIDNDPSLRTMAPRQVKKAFADVIAADQDRGKAVSEAQGYANSVRNRAAGEAQIVVNAGKTDADRLLQSVAADAQYFEDQLPHYKANPELFLARLQTEALRRILTNATDKILRLDNGKRPMWIQLNREPSKPMEKKEAQGPGQTPVR